MDKQMTITISGKQGSGKTRIAEIIRAALNQRQPYESQARFKAEIAEDEEDIKYLTKKGYIIIRTEQV